MDYNHKEAFAMMCYRCNNCSAIENVWNSRDGVTPFMIICPNCSELEMQHVNWDRDREVAIPLLREGDLVFTSETKEEAERRKKLYVENIWEKNTYGCREEFKTKENMVEQLMRSFQEGQPSVKKVKYEFIERDY